MSTGMSRGGAGVGKDRERASAAPAAKMKSRRLAKLASRATDISRLWPAKSARGRSGSA